MAARLQATGQDLINQVLRTLEAGASPPLAQEPVAVAAPKLEAARRLLQDHSTTHAKDYSHQTFNSYSEWWTEHQQRFPGKLAIAEDGTLDRLYEHIGVLYSLGTPLTLTEKLTPEFRFCQDIEVQGSREEMVPAEELVGASSPFLGLLASCVAECFRANNDQTPREFLDALVFEACGMSRTKGVLKTSIRLVWPALVVDAATAGMVRDYTVAKIKESQDPYFAGLLARIRGLSQENAWEAVLGDSIYSGRVGIRLPLCDRVSPPPMKRPESRPFKPFAALRLSLSNGSVTSIVPLAADLPLDQWVKFGAVRQPLGQTKSEFTPPAGQRRQPPGPRPPDVVRIRPNGGSPGDYSRGRPGPPKRKDPERIEKEPDTTVHRQFHGTVGEFRSRLVEVLGDERVRAGTTEDKDDLYVYTFEGTARVEFRPAFRRVDIVGKHTQIRVLVQYLTFCRVPDDDGRSSAAASAPGTQRAATASGSQLAPSAVYTPSYAPSVVYPQAPYPDAQSLPVLPSQVDPYEDPAVRPLLMGTADPLPLQSGVWPGEVPAPPAPAGPSAAAPVQRPPAPAVVPEVQVVGPNRRVVKDAYTPEDPQSEAELRVGDHWIIVDDPESGTADNRWVLGYNVQEPGCKRWFPLHFTKPA